MDGGPEASCIEYYSALEMLISASSHREIILTSGKYLMFQQRRQALEATGRWASIAAPPRGTWSRPTGVGWASWATTGRCRARATRRNTAAGWVWRVRGPGVARGENRELFAGALKIIVLFVLCRDAEKSVEDESKDAPDSSLLQVNY